MTGVDRAGGGTNWLVGERRRGEMAGGRCVRASGGMLLLWIVLTTLAAYNFYNAKMVALQRGMSITSI